MVCQPALGSSRLRGSAAPSEDVASFSACHEGHSRGLPWAWVLLSPGCSRDPQEGVGSHCLLSARLLPWSPGSSSLPVAAGLGWVSPGATGHLPAEASQLQGARLTLPGCAQSPSCPGPLAGFTPRGWQLHPAHPWLAQGVSGGSPHLLPPLLIPFGFVGDTGYAGGQAGGVGPWGSIGSCACFLTRRKSLPPDPLCVVPCPGRLAGAPPALPALPILVPLHASSC